MLIAHFLLYMQCIRSIKEVGGPTVASYEAFVVNFPRRLQKNMLKCFRIYPQACTAVFFPVLFFSFWQDWSVSRKKVLSSTMRVKLIRTGPFFFVIGGRGGLVWGFHWLLVAHGRMPVSSPVGNLSFNEMIGTT